MKYFYIQDVAVLPDYQGRGFGRAIVDELLSHVRGVAPASAFVGLFATDEARSLYAGKGFSEGSLRGMFRLVEATGS